MSIFPSLPADAMDEKALAEELLAWATDWEGHEVPAREMVEVAYHTVSPRSVFLKNLPQGSSVLDLGAGDGGLSNYLAWPAPDRSDLSLYALSLSEGALFDRYAGMELGDFEKAPMDFGGRQFDAAICAHFIEHMHGLDRTVEYLRERLKPGGRVYIEWPHPASGRFPTRHDFIGNGLPTSTTNFHDDPTHVEAWSMEQVTDALKAQGFALEAMGRIHLPWLADALKLVAHRHNDITCGTFAVWCKAGFAQYLVASRR
ncbi:class I SAM-dependent methyltransferase [Rhodovarius crocodyli]|uniref:Class I SAM-dependent methyltransferase n=1 Tax=Rhodovarius crocodyli TaxID=1979269 RepID=A0A437MGY6_9PROT|nr:class I SAM-dependent methyltransferase [Rhodovarius crocodyli]RVT96920.1 class I SAM-dependent methyltransferase [Rhodovarius crocodyli]